MLQIFLSVIYETGVLVRLGWKSLPGTNNLDYLPNFINYGLKKFYNTGPRVPDTGEPVL
jgi:hypothetical protein